MPLYDILEPNNAFLGNKNRNFKESKNWHFLKGINACFWSKNFHFFNFSFLGNIGQENVFCDILEAKNTLLGYKNTKFKKSKNWYFSKGVNPWFWSKNCHFFNFLFLGNIGQENAYLRYFRTKQRVSRQLKQEFQIVEKLTFLQMG